MLMGPVLAIFWGPVVTLVTFSSNLSNLKSQKTRKKEEKKLIIKKKIQKSENNKQSKKKFNKKIKEIKR